MGRKCFVTNCRSGYASCTDRLSMFKAPSDEKLLNKWRIAIPRADRLLTEKDCVCEKHFAPQDIVRNKTETHQNVVLYDIKIRPKLSPNAVPTIFPNCPQYMTKIVKPPRKSVYLSRDASKATSSNECQLAVETSSNSISFDALVQEVQRLPICDESWGLHVCTKSVNKFILFSAVNADEENGVHIFKSLHINEDLQWQFRIRNKLVNSSSFDNVPQVIHSVSELMILLELIINTNTCIGGPAQSKYGNVSVTSTVSDNGKWYHKGCKLLVDKYNKSCVMCKKVRNTLSASLSRQKQQKQIKRFRMTYQTTKIKALIKSKNSLKKSLKLLHLRAKRFKTDLNNMMQKMSLADQVLLTNTFKDVNISTAQQMLIKECLSVAKMKSKNGRRYTSDWLLLCILLYIRNSSMYKFLREQEILPLPCISNIQRYLSTVNIQCGFDASFFSALEIVLNKKEEKQRHGIIILDEIQVRKSISLNSKEMTYSGLVDFGETYEQTCSNELADHGLVFLFQPFADSWTQPIAVFASLGPTKSIVLSQLLIQAVICLEEAGAIVDAAVCDGASTNRSMWADLGVSGKLGDVKSYFTHPLNIHRKIWMFSDAPHLIKCIRNRLLAKQELLLNGQYIKWQYYLDLFNEDMKLPGNLRLCPKITPSHLKPNNMEKMRVMLATQIFSNSVAEGLEFYRQRGIIATDAEATILFTLQINCMFDALNRQIPSDGVRIDCKDFKTLQTSLNWLDEWEHEVVRKEINKNSFLTASTAEGLRVTLMSTIELSSYLLNSCGFNYVLTGKFNQDPIERFFGNIRQAAGANDHPTMPTFLQLYRLLSIYSILRPPKFGNCKELPLIEQPCISIAEFKNAFNSANKETEGNLKQLQSKLDDCLKDGKWECDDFIEEDYGMPEVRKCIVYYVTGFVCRKITKFSDCNVCQSAIVNPVRYNDDYPDAQLTNLKTWGQLVHPNLHLYSLLSFVEDYFSANAGKHDIYWCTFNHVLDNRVLTFPCIEHKNDMMMKILHYYISLRMRQFSKQNNLASGRETREKRKLSKLFTD